MSKAEEFAYSKYPKSKRGVLYDLARNSIIQGYHQAEKDLELTWEDIETIQEMANKYCKHHSCEPRFFVYSEILKRFKDFKEKKEK